MATLRNSRKRGPNGEPMTMAELATILNRDYPWPTPAEISASAEQDEELQRRITRKRYDRGAALGFTRAEVFRINHPDMRLPGAPHPRPP
jgi:hypothetical protein